MVRRTWQKAFVDCGRLLLLVFILNCQQTSTDTLLEGQFTGTDTTPPLLLRPENNSRIAGFQVQLFWSARKGAATYSVEVATTPDFSNQIAGSPFTANGTSLVVNVSETATYWWRVRAPFTKGTLNVSSFDTLTDAIYVYCPENQSCSDTGKGGSRTNPYQSITAALGAAKIFNLPIRVASRGAGGQAYNEAVSLADGVSIYGGYNSAFNESQRNPVTNVTEIRSAAIPVTATSITQSTVVDGFKINGQLSFGVYLDNSNANLVIRNCTITSGNVATGSTFAVFAISSSVVLMRNTIIAGGATATGGAGDSVGIYNTASSLTLTNNVILGGATSGDGSTYGIINLNGSSPLIVNNTIAGGNALKAGVLPSSFGISTGDTSGNFSNPNIVNNVIFSLDTTGTIICINETGNAGFSNPASLRNNLLFDCATAFYRNLDGATTSITAIANVNNALLSIANPNTGGVIASGNVTISGGQNPFVDLGARNFRLQNNGGTMTAQEWLNIAYGGLDSSGAALGSVTTDRDSASRTATGGGATNTGATGYSIGAYEF